MDVIITTVIILCDLQISHWICKYYYRTILSCAIYFICIITNIALDLYYNHVVICKTKIKVYKNKFLEKTQGYGDLGIDCDKFIKNLFALRPCFQPASYLSATKRSTSYDDYLQSVYPKYSIQLNLYILTIKLLIPVGIQTKIVALFK